MLTTPIDPIVRPAPPVRPDITHLSVAQEAALLVFEMAVMQASIAARGSV